MWCIAAIKKIIEKTSDETVLKAIVDATGNPETGDDLRKALVLLSDTVKKGEKIKVDEIMKILFENLYEYV